MCSLSRSFRLSSTLRIQEEAMVMTKNHGICSVLESHISDETSNKSSSSSSSLRRTLSADMSSTKWLTQHGLSPLKMIASSEELSIRSITDSSSSEERQEDEDDETDPRSQFDIWSSIIQQKSQEITDLAPPYIHPLVKRSATSSLTQKSLQICTESLGSETGSDGLISCSYPSSDSSDVTDDDKDREQERSVEQSFDNFEEQGSVSVPIYNYVKKSLQRRSFPPPMPSRLMQSRRDNGKLILEYVSVPSANNNFLAQRRDGRLVLTFAASSIEQGEEGEEKEEFEEEFESFDDEDKESDEAEEEEEEEEEATFVMELQAPKVSSRVIILHRLTLANRDTTLTTWPNKFNDVVKLDEVEEDIKPAIVAKSLPPMARLIPKPSAAAAGGGGGDGGGGGGGGASLNAYEYSWRPKPLTTTQSKSKKNTPEEQQQLLFLRGNKGENLVPLVKSCKEPRRSLLFWEPYCIATS